MTPEEARERYAVRRGVPLGRLPRRIDASITLNKAVPLDEGELVLHLHAHSDVLSWAIGDTLLMPEGKAYRVTTIAVVPMTEQLAKDMDVEFDPDDYAWRVEGNPI